MARVTYSIGMLLLFAAVSLLVYNGLSRTRTLAARLRPIRRADPSRVPSPIFRALYPALDWLAPYFHRLRWTDYRSKMSLELQRAGVGDAITVDHILALKAITAIVFPFVLSRLFGIFANPALFLLAAIGGFYLPDKLVSDMRSTRQRKLLRALPGSVDVLSLSVEAGLEFLTAMQRLTERGGIGPLRDEMATILNDIRLGKTRSEALKAFASRMEIPEVSSFTSVLVQADTLGASIGPVLQQQAERMRVERFQRAEKAGARATQKILLPLVLFIFPAVLIVIIGPVALQFVYGR